MIISKKKIILCEINVLARFFKDDELSEMVKMLKSLTRDPEVSRIVEKYGKGFDIIFFDGKVEGKAEVAKNLLAEGLDEEIVSRNTGISIEDIRKLKRKL